jgi:hypothetical protein
MAPEQIFVLDDRALERLQNHSRGEQLLGQWIAPKQLIVRENQAAGDFFQT